MSLPLLRDIGAYRQQMRAYANRATAPELYEPVIILMGGGDAPHAATHANAGNHEGRGNKAARDPVIAQNLIHQFTEAGKVVYAIGPETDLATLVQTAPRPSIMVNTPPSNSLGANIRIGLERVMDDYASLPGVMPHDGAGSWNGKDLRDLVVGVSFSDYVTTAANIEEADGLFLGASKQEAGGKAAGGLLYVRNETYEPGWEDKGIFDLSGQLVSAGQYHWVRPAHLRRAFVDNMSTTVYHFRSTISQTSCVQKLAYAFKPKNFPRVKELARRVRETYHSEDHPILERDLRGGAIPTILQYLLFRKVQISAFENALVTATVKSDSRAAGWGHFPLIFTNEKAWMRDGDYEEQREALAAEAAALLRDVA